MEESKGFDPPQVVLFFVVYEAFPRQGNPNLYHHDTCDQRTAAAIDACAPAVSSTELHFRVPSNCCIDVVLVRRWSGCIADGCVSSTVQPDRLAVACGMWYEYSIFVYCKSSCHVSSRDITPPRFLSGVIRVFQPTP